MLLIVAGSFILNIFVDSESTSTTINIIGLIVMVVVVIYSRIMFSRDSKK